METEKEFYFELKELLSKYANELGGKDSIMGKRTRLIESAYSTLILNKEILDYGITYELLCANFACISITPIFNLFREGIYNTSVIYKLGGCEFMANSVSEKFGSKKEREIEFIIISNGLVFTLQCKDVDNNITLKLIYNDKPILTCAYSIEKDINVMQFTKVEGEKIALINVAYVALRNLSKIANAGNESTKK